MKKLITYISVLLIIIISYNLYVIFVPIKNIPTDAFNINEGESLQSITKRMEDDGYIRSALMFRLLSSFYYKDKSIQYGKYNLSEVKSPSLYNIYKSIINGDSFEPSRRLTIPEGFTTRDIAKRVSETFDISPDEFYRLAKNYNGYLYPNTYFFSSNSTSGDIISKLKKEFDKRVGEIDKENVVMASIIEGEGKNLEDMRMIAGILKARLELGMPLQVDVAPITYKEKDVPDNPINNPGPTAFEALMNPIKSKYLYYITGSDGKFYYAKTYEEHKENIKKHLK